MKKYLLLFLLLPSICFAGFGYTIPDTGQTIASGDACTGGLIFSWHAESINVAPSGCSLIGDSEATANGTVTLSNVDKSDGTYSVLSDANNESYVFDISQNFSSAEGTLRLDCRIVTFASSEKILEVYASSDSANDRIQVAMQGSSGAYDIIVHYKGAGSDQYVSVDSMNLDEADNKWVRIKYQWKTAADTADHRLDVWELDSASPRVPTATTWSDADAENVTAHDSTIDKLQVGADASFAGAMYIDNIKLYSTSEL